MISFLIVWHTILSYSLISRLPVSQRLFVAIYSIQVFAKLKKKNVSILRVAQKETLTNSSCQTGWPFLPDRLYCTWRMWTGARLPFPKGKKKGFQLKYVSSHTKIHVLGRTEAKLLGVFLSSYRSHWSHWNYVRKTWMRWAVWNIARFVVNHRNSY